MFTDTGWEDYSYWLEHDAKTYREIKPRSRTREAGHGTAPD
ncbi:MAG: type II toxin-antitoxin system YoeB family toxin [Lachnospiraceae bacterium]|nr:type II toxin-antitoxin system YoeB family toxin [Lachnospiraceae bacterium]